MDTANFRGIHMAEAVRSAVPVMPVTVIQAEQAVTVRQGMLADLAALLAVMAVQRDSGNKAAHTQALDTHTGLGKATELGILMAQKHCIQRLIAVRTKRMQAPIGKAYLKQLR